MSDLQSIQSNENSEDGSMNTFESSIDGLQEPMSEMAREILLNLFPNEIISHLCLRLKKLDIKWKKMGLKFLENKDKINKLSQEMVTTFNRFVEEEESQYQLYLEEINEMERKIETLLQEMIIYTSDDQLSQLIKTVQTPKNYENINMPKRISKLKLMFETLEGRRNEYLSNLSREQNTFKALIQKLGLNENQFSNLFSSSLTKTELEDLRGKISFYQSQLQEREIECCQMAKMINFIGTIIPLEINVPFLKENKKNENSLKEDFIYSESNLKKLKSYYEKFKKVFNDKWLSIVFQVEQLKKIYVLFDDKKSQIEWFDLIESIEAIKDCEHVLDFLYSNWKYFPSGTNLQKIYSELETEHRNFDRLKKERIGTIIQNIRQNYLKLSKQCLLDIDSMQTNPKFKFLFATNFDPESLELHEKEFKKLTKYYEKYKEFFDMMYSWHELEREMEELERKKSDIDVMKNRGGILQKILDKQRLNKKKLIQIKQKIQIWFRTKLPLLENKDDLTLDYFGFDIENHLGKLDDKFQSKSKPGSKLISTSKRTSFTILRRSQPGKGQIKLGTKKIN